MRPEDLVLLIEQSRLAAEANAIARGLRGARPAEIACEVGVALGQCGIRKNQSDAQLIELYARGELESLQLAEHFIRGS
jgi:hypothetical protein